MAPQYLSKSDFKTARSCPTKLFYKKNKYPSTKETNDYLQMLAQGGFMVEKMARLLFEDGVEVGYNLAPEAAARETAQHLAAAENVTLYEATVIHGARLARIDVLRKRGNRFDLIEVKAKSYDSVKDTACVAKTGRGLFWSQSKGKQDLTSDWREYLEDVCFQTLVLRRNYPDAEVHSYLMMPDKAKTCGIEAVHEHFVLRPVEGSFRDAEVDFTGDVAQLRRDHFLALVPVDQEVTHLQAEVDLAASELEKSVRPELVKLSTPLSKDCADCEYRHAERIEKDGYRECWRELADVSPHVFDLYFMGTLGGAKTSLVNQLIGQKKVSLFAIAEDDLKDAKGNVGARNERQLIQIRHTRAGTEWRDPALTEFLGGLEYPLHFVDFETSTMAIPYHAGMRPYESVAFQWSCHTIPSSGAPLEHKEWINTVDALPNFAFARSLMEHVGYGGTLFMYATHENTTLKATYRQMEERKVRDPELTKWLEDTVGLENARDSRFIDMNALTLKHYFHPIMRGKTSLKNVSEAIWETNAALRESFPEYVRRDEHGKLQSPYKALPPMVVAGEDVAVREGTAAMTAYQEMFYGRGRYDTQAREQYKQLLLQYCKLDTLVMVWLWMHWLGVREIR